LRIVSRRERNGTTWPNRTTADDSVTSEDDSSRGAHAACLELEAAFAEAWSDAEFVSEYHTVLKEFADDDTRHALTRLGDHLGLRIFAKREDLAHTGSHKINNVIGQTLLTKRMGKRRVIAETGAGQHGVATATAAARLGLECTVFMGEVDTERQILNVFRMELLGSRWFP